MRIKWLLFFIILSSCSSPTQELIEEKKDEPNAVVPPKLEDTPETPPLDDAVTLELEKIKEVATQSTYKQEIDGAPARPTWVDAFRYYPEAEFLKKGRYLLVWRKDPGERSIPAERFELHQILFKDPTAMSQSDNFGKPIDPTMVESTNIIFTENMPKIYPKGLVELPTNLLKPDIFSTDSSENYPAFIVDVADETQVGYFPLTIDNNSRQLVVAYKVRAYTTAKDTDDKGNIIDVELYNDSPIMYMNYKTGLFVQVTEDTTGGGGLTPNEYIADEIVSMSALREKLGYNANQNFEDTWESNKVDGITPLEELITEDDFNTLIPIAHRTAGHDKDGTYYTWRNFVEASRYFPKFLNEGTKEDRYRELAALLGNKGQEVGGSLGPASTTEDKWNANLYWIVEIGALAGITVKSNEDIYKAFSNHYTQIGHAEYPPVEGKSYHGRGPVQLSWNYNYGRMSEVLFGDKNILLENPNLVAREGILGWASAIWFWMEPQGVKPSCHDVMVGNVDLSEPYTPPVDKSVRSSRTHTIHSKGHKADGTPISYEKLNLGLGLEVGFGMTINIINGGLESNGGLGGFDNRQARRIAFYARYLDYFGKMKKGRDDGEDLPISPQISSENGIGGDPVPNETIALFREWRNWRYLPQDGTSPDGTKDFPKEKMPSIIASHYMESLR